MLCCFLVLLLTAMTCDEEELLPPILADVVGVRLVSLDNSGHVPEPVTDDRCPKEAYMMKVMQHVKEDAEETSEAAWRRR